MPNVQQLLNRRAKVEALLAQLNAEIDERTAEEEASKKTPKASPTKRGRS